MLNEKNKENSLLKNLEKMRKVLKNGAEKEQKKEGFLTKEEKNYIIKKMFGVKNVK